LTGFAVTSASVNITVDGIAVAMIYTISLDMKGILYGSDFFGDKTLSR
jgi:hypothetical protein